MKPFNLEEAKSGKPVCTKDGQSVRIICFDKKSSSIPMHNDQIVALVSNEEGREISAIYSLDGEFIPKTDNLTLMMVGENKVGWINLYSNSATISGAEVDENVYESEEEAKSRIPANIPFMSSKGYVNYIKTIKIEWED